MRKRRIYTVTKEDKVPIWLGSFYLTTLDRTAYAILVTYKPPYAVLATRVCAKENS